MIAAGTLVEVGQLEDEHGEVGVVLRRPGGGFITIKGLTAEEVRALAPQLYKDVSIKLEAPP